MYLICEYNKPSEINGLAIMSGQSSNSVKMKVWHVDW